MRSQRDSFIHVQTPKGRSLGFSALFTDVSDMAESRNKQGDLMCWFTITFCNKKDKHFCKKLAREALREKAQEWVRVRDLPKILSKAEARCCAIKWGEHAAAQESRYNFVLRRFV